MRNENKIKGLTVVELLVVLAVMALLVSLLLPAVTMVVNLAKTTKQKAQFATISIALETFRNDFGDYPESYNNNSYSYCGAQMLAEAMVGYDLFGVHSKTNWYADGSLSIGGNYDATDPTNLKARKGPYIEVEKAGAVRLDDVSGEGDGLYHQIGGVSTVSARYVLTDSYKRTYNFNIDNSGTDDTVKFGMPILYFKARTNKYKLDSSSEDDSVFDYRHNADFLDKNLKAPWDATKTHEMTSAIFYTDDDYIINKAISNSTDKVPYNKDSFILISAGKDGLYGTDDDIFNFDKE